MLRKLSWIVVLLVITNGAVYLWGELRLRGATAEASDRLEASARMAQERQEEISTLRAKLDRLEAWSHLVDLQEQLRGIDAEIEKLNYGNASEQLKALEERIRDGEMGGLLAGMSKELAPRFEAVQGELKAMGEHPSARLGELGRSAFETVSGFAAQETGGSPLPPELDMSSEDPTDDGEAEVNKTPEPEPEPEPADELDGDSKDA